MSKKFPKQLYVKVAGEGSGEYFEADETPNSADDGDLVAIYQLVEVKIMSVTQSLESRGRSRRTSKRPRRSLR